MEIILTRCKVSAEEAFCIGLCEKVVPKGRAREAAEAMAQEIARLPQAAVRADRANVYKTYGLSMREALKREWANGLEAHHKEGAEGAARFASGEGRQGDFADIV